jgi:hypothetical protein
MQVIAIIEDSDVIIKILKHMGLWDVKSKPRPVANAPPNDVFPAYEEQPGPRAGETNPNDPNPNTPNENSRNLVMRAADVAKNSVQSIEGTVIKAKTGGVKQ